MSSLEHCHPKKWQRLGSYRPEIQLTLLTCTKNEHGTFQQELKGIVVIGVLTPV